MADMVLLAGEEIDAALLPIGDRYTMGPEDAVRAAEMIQPRLVIPMHYDTFPTIEQDPQAFRRLAEEKTGIPVAVLKPGEAIMLKKLLREIVRIFCSLALKFQLISQNYLNI